MQKKQGISLIVLVITIIVMIILAASVVISLNNTGVIDKANTAVKLTDEGQVQDLAALAWAEAYLDEDRTDSIETVVKEKLAEQGVTEEDWDITVTNTGVNVKAKDTKTLISFTIGSTSYQAEEGMTWEKWAQSTYNTAEATITSSKVYIGSAYVTTSGSTSVTVTNPIDANTTYSLYTASSSGSATHSG